MLHPNLPPPLLQVLLEAGHEEGLGQAPGRDFGRTVKDPFSSQPRHPGRALTGACGSTCPEVPDAPGRGQPSSTSSPRRGGAGQRT